VILLRITALVPFQHCVSLPLLLDVLYGAHDLRANRADGIVKFLSGIGLFDKQLCLAGRQSQLQSRLLILDDRQKALETLGFKRPEQF